MACKCIAINVPSAKNLIHNLVLSTTYYYLPEDFIGMEEEEVAVAVAMAVAEQPSSVVILPDAKKGAASMLVAKIADLMDMCLNAGQLHNNPSLFSDLCCSLAKAIDHAVANNEVPIRSRDLPPLLRQVYVYSDDFNVKHGLMMLTMSIQSACKLQWFPDKDTKDLLMLAKEVLKTFSDPEYIRIEPTNASFLLSKVMPRFYPNMKIDRMLFCLKLKPGARFCVAGFPIIRGTVVPKQEKIHLLVVQLDNLMTSACIITPPKVNFVLNGQGVEGRTLQSMDTEPQLPTNVTAKLKYGVNSLQAIGEFNGNFLIVIAVMSNTQSSNALDLQDYVRPAALTDSDDQTMEMSPRISLNCPISKSRIKTPVKGKFCKHLQCFDYDNFLKMNSKRPSWRCPHCKQPVCYVNLRIDRNVVKVLREAEEKVVNVIISANGSWKEDSDHSVQMDGGSQVRHHGGQQNLESLSRNTAGGSTSLQNDNQTFSAAGTHVPNQNITSNLLGSEFSSKAPLSHETHDNSSRLLQYNSSNLHSQSFAADTCSIGSPFMEEYQHLWSLPNLNTSEDLSNTLDVINQLATISHRDPFPLTSRTASWSDSSVVVDDARTITLKAEPQEVNLAAHDALPDWRLTKRMRGSLTGEAYSAAFNQFMIQPTQHAQASQSVSYLVPTPSNIPQAEIHHQSPGDSGNSTSGC
ncbi:hypothetical protein ACH5RR_000133 [Cinchona calisaya]|uniref:SP-RING-type domain-containing protein n=1 Tax=Cinchona calisaya TaxID=153742 RepID=A0ABD3AZR6_9GENT